MLSGALLLTVVLTAQAPQAAPVAGSYQHYSQQSSYTGATYGGYQAGGYQAGGYQTSCGQAAYGAQPVRYKERRKMKWGGGHHGGRRRKGC